MDPNVPAPQKQVPWTTIWIIVISLLVIAGLVYFFMMRPAPSTTTTTTATPTTQTLASTSPSASFTSDTDLQTASSDLDKVDVDGVDSGLTQNDTDAATF